MIDEEDFDGTTRDIAVKALIHIQMHEKLCASRWGLFVKLALSILGLLGAEVCMKLFEFVHFGLPIPHG